METTPGPTRRLRQAIHSLVGSEEPSYMFEEQKRPEEDEPEANGR